RRQRVRALELERGVEVARRALRQAGAGQEGEVVVVERRLEGRAGPEEVGPRGDALARRVDRRRPHRTGEARDRRDGPGDGHRARRQVVERGALRRDPDAAVAAGAAVVAARLRGATGATRGVDNAAGRDRDGVTRLEQDRATRAAAAAAALARTRVRGDG